MPAIDIRKLRPSEVCRLVNSTPLGTVLDERHLYRHRSRAGYRIGDDQHIDMFRYAAWLVELKHTPRPEPDGDPYATVKERASERNLAISRAGREIGELPPAKHPARKKRCRGNFRAFAERYFPVTFTLKWSPDHLKVIGKIEQAVLKGGLFAVAMPRGSGKTSLVECACLWAVLYGHHQYVVFIGASEVHALEMLESVKTELETNEEIAGDFPEVCFPIAKLDGINQRRLLYRGARVRMEFTQRRIVLPTIEESAASGAVIAFTGITGRIRGMKFKRPDGYAARPSFVIIDDPQTDESARSPSQCQQREAILAGAVLGLAGPGKPIAGIMPCTVICPGDMADRILNRDVHPAWNGERTQMLYSFPTNDKLWQEYARIRKESQRSGGTGKEATRFYREHRAEMDAGAVVAWPARRRRDDLSALQHAMNLKIDRGDTAFAAEFQNVPMLPDTASRLTAAQVMGKANGLDRGVVPLKCQHLTAYVDVHLRLLYWVVAAWDGEFGGAVIDYGTWPQQPVPYFAQESAPLSMQLVHGLHDEDAWILASLTKLIEELLGRRFRREDGGEMSVGKLLIDARWGEKTDLVKTFCRRHPQYMRVVTAAMGFFVGATSKPFGEYRQEPGTQVGTHWRIPPAVGGSRHAIVDVNWWKTLTAARLAMPLGAVGGWEVFGRNRSQHHLFADHCVAEEAVEVTAKGRTVTEWKLPPAKPDNHYWDCLVGSAVGASILGCQVPGRERPVRRVLSLQAMAQATRGR